MHPRPFEYTKASCVGEAVAVLASDEEARVLAGGQSLVPMLSLGLARPSLLVDVGGLDLAGVERRNGVAVVGALTRQRELERSARARELLPLAAEAAAHVGNPRVRNRGTFGGSLAHADPAAELCTVALAHGGQVILAGPAGERTVPVREFFHGFYETAARHDEVLVRAELELPPAGSGTAFVEVAPRADAFATAGAAAIVTLEAEGRGCREARVAVLGLGGAPIRVPAAEELCRGEAASPTLLAAVATSVEAAAPDAPSEHRRRCAGICAARAVGAAFARARAGGAG